LPFTERLKLSVKREAHFSCCLCHSLGVEVHHIIPQEEGGPDSKDNAAPLCPSCHETYGANPQKRKFIREVRDFWYELCAKRYASDADQLDKILSVVEETASKSDLGTINSRIVELGEIVQKSLSNLVEREKYVAQIDHMQQRITYIESELQSKALSVEQLGKRSSVAQLGANISIEMAYARYSDLDEKALTAYTAILKVLRDGSGISPDDFVQIFEDAFQEVNVPDEPIRKALYCATQQFKYHIQLGQSMNIAALVVPSLLDEFDKNPDRSIKDYQKALVAHIRAGDLDLSKFIAQSTNKEVDKLPNL
jgi:hypothetical protein